LLNIGWNSL